MWSLARIAQYNIRVRNIPRCTRWHGPHPRTTEAEYRTRRRRNSIHYVRDTWGQQAALPGILAARRRTGASHRHARYSKALSAIGQTKGARLEALRYRARPAPIPTHEMDKRRLAPQKMSLAWRHPAREWSIRNLLLRRRPTWRRCRLQQPGIRAPRRDHGRDRHERRSAFR
jgi:hypothetical protein